MVPEKHRQPAPLCSQSAKNWVSNLLRRFVTRNKPLLLQLAQAEKKPGFQEKTWFLADASGEMLWSLLKETRRELSLTAAQIVGKEPLPAGWIVAPIRAGEERVLGFLGVCAPDAARSNLETHAALLGHVLARERELTDMTVELMNAYDQLVAMYHVSEATRSHLELDDILRSLVDEAMRLCKARHGFVAMQRNGEIHCVTCVPPHPQHEALTVPLLQIVRERGQALICNTPSDLSVALPDAPKGMERCLAAPITVDDQVVATLGLLDKPTPFTAGDQKLLVALADEAGAIVERAHLQAQLLAQERLRRELEIAAEIQTGLLPTVLPTIPGLDVAARCRPANEVGGDFYDFLSHPASPLGIVLGDVTSKGVPAALFVTVAHTILHSAFPGSPTPQALLERLNADMYDELTRASMFVTLFIAYYDPKERRLVSANAGHSPVLYYDARAGRCHLWEADGPPVGVLPDVLSADHVVEPHPGDILVVMSDGFNEMVNPSEEMFGIESLMRLLEEHAGRSAAQIQDRFFEAVTTFAQEAPQADDLTICILKVT